MKCQQCKSTCERSDCFPGPTQRSAQLSAGWTVYYCTERGCRFASEQVPQRPRRKVRKTTMEVLSAKVHPEPVV